MTKAGRSVSIVRRTRRAWRRLGAVGFVTLVGKNLRLYLSGDAKDHAYVYNAQFDRDFDVDTLGVVEIDEMAVSDEAAIGAARYEPIQPEFFAHLVERLPAIEPSDFTFVDVGSGKGRALILAAVAGFRTVIGVEFDGGLHRAALTNIDRVRDQFPDVSFELRHQDARDFTPPEGSIIVMVNNPFDQSVLIPLLMRLEQLGAKQIQPFYLIYGHCLHVDQVIERRCWKLLERSHFQTKRHPYAIFELAVQ
ncbi:hypothetical protein [Sphingomonas sp.]|uniref:hypothetical protein n=1 Tax=Sphingomonas sp. TaxID=28214 RepID=UPI0035A89001